MVKENTMKQTEIGLLPEDWEVVNLNDVSKISSSKRIFESDYVPYGIPFYRGKEISLLMQNKTIDEPFYISEAKYFSLANKYGYPKNGDLLITAVGTLGNIYCINDDDKFYFKDGNLIWINNIIQNSKFLKIALDYNKQQILDNAIGSSQKALTINSLSITKIPLPPLPEQEAIADALSDADAWIESLEQLIAKKRLIKQGAMQELLSPKEDWRLKKLGEVGVFFSTNSLSRDDLNYLDGQIYNIHYGDIHTRFKSHFNLENELVPFINEVSIGNKKFNRCQVGDLIIADASENETDIGKAIEISNLNEKLVASGLHTIHYRPNPQTFSLHYLGHLWQSEFIKEQILKEAQGTKVLGISVSRLKDLNIPIISLTEQIRIATILSDMDAELEALEGQLGKARKVKQGMMQELLTGRVRLV